MVVADPARGRDRPADDRRVRLDASDGRVARPASMRHGPRHGRSSRSCQRASASGSWRSPRSPRRSSRRRPIATRSRTPSRASTPKNGTAMGDGLMRDARSGRADPDGRRTATPPRVARRRMRRAAPERRASPDASAPRTRRSTRRRASRWSPRSCCPTAPTPSARRSRSTPRNVPRRLACRCTRSRWAPRTGRSRSVTTSARLRILAGAAGHRDARPDRRDHRRARRSTPRPPRTCSAVYDNLESRIGHVDRATGGHRPGSPAAALAAGRRRGRPVRALVRPAAVGARRSNAARVQTGGVTPEERREFIARQHHAGTAPVVPEIDPPRRRARDAALGAGRPRRRPPRRAAALLGVAVGGRAGAGSIRPRSTRRSSADASVADIGAGGGIVAIAAALAGAR